MSGTAAPAASLRTATSWSYALSLGKMGISLGLAFVLAAMLGPRAFGVIAMALVFINFVEMLQQQGLMPAIVSRKVLTDLHADTAFWLVTGVGLVCTIAAVVSASWWADVNGLPELAAVIRILALTVPLTSTVVIHEALLRRRLAFKQLTIRTWVSLIAGGIAGLVGAILGLGVWALVLQQVVTSIVAVIVLWTVSPWRPRFRVDRVSARELWSYSTRAASSSLGLFIGGRVDVLLTGVLFGPVVVGLYRLAQRLTSTAVDVTARGMQAVALPGLAGVQDDRIAFAARLLRMQRITTALALPLLGLLAGAAGPVEEILGPEWDGTATAIRLLTIMQAFAAISLLLGPALQAWNRPGTLSIVIWATSALKVLALVGAAWAADEAIGLIALCVAMIVATAIGSVVIVVVSSRVLRVRLTAMLLAWLPGAVGGLAAVAVTGGVVQLVALPALFELLIAGVVGSLVAGLILWALAPEIRSTVGSLRARLRRSPRPADHEPIPVTVESEPVRERA
ncbi:oligosaccharide flippase family protein [Occultella gossypii]|uniref:Oligosaccharide flippase family protein n=1 Tax=Occultella gossypii TaxID=2800820 RepID=A0ABS7S8W7_9MICO|nr:oligosaccharide flippase family protein [Occultella gossypii]MBZ2196732.1 oligosaccharide flippase family protein [Occultella gossypii]